MAIYDLYGSTSDDILEVKKFVEDSLGVEFDSRVSEYQGGEYFQWGRTSGEHLILKRNIDPTDGGPAEISFSNYKVLLYLNDTPRSEELQRKILQGINQLVILRHEDLD